MKSWALFIVIAVIWLSFCVWTSQQIAPPKTQPPPEPFRPPSMEAHRLATENQELRQEIGRLRAELKACQSSADVLPSERGDDPEDDPGR